VRRWARTPKGLLTLVFVPLLVVGAAATPGVAWPEAAAHVAVAAGAACAVDVWAYRRVRRTASGARGHGGRGGWRWPSSALLSGVIVAFVLGPETPRGATAAVAALAVVSKYIIRSSTGHVFNPAALALLASIPLFQPGQSWWGALGDTPLAWTALLLVGGLLVTERVGKLPLALSFVGMLYLLLTVAGVAAPLRVRSQLAELFRPPFLHATLFAAFFMLSDPPTAPGGELEQIWVGALVGASAVAAHLAGVGQAYLLVGVLAGNVAVAVRAEYRRRALEQEASRRGHGRGTRGAAGGGPARPVWSRGA
jgi:hypothetical protein